MIEGKELQPTTSVSHEAAGAFRESKDLCPASKKDLGERAQLDKPIDKTRGSTSKKAADKKACRDDPSTRSGTMSAELFERLEREFLAHEEASAVSAAARKRKSRKAASNKVTRAYASAPFELVEHPAGMASSVFASATGPSDPPGKGTRKRVRRRRADGQAAGGGTDRCGG